MIREVDDSIALQLAVVENIQKANLHPLDEAAAYAALLKADKKATHASVGRQCSKTPAHVFKRCQLLKLSAAVRLFYGDIFHEIMEAARPGPTLELGSGIGVIKEFYPEVVTSDIAVTPFVDLPVSCYEIAALARRWRNLVAVDVLHHLRYPFEFFASAAGVLERGGRIILTEPAAIPWGRLFYTLFHHEPIAPPYWVRLSGSTGIPIRENSLIWEWEQRCLFVMRGKRARAWRNTGSTCGESGFVILSVIR